MNFQDLIGIPYKWNGSSPKEGLDCFGLVQFIRQIQGLPLIQGLDWIYQEYPKESDLLPDTMPLIIKSVAQRRKGEIMHSDILYLEWRGTYGLGTALRDEGRVHGIYFDGKTKQSVAVTVLRLAMLIEGIYYV